MSKLFDALKGNKKLSAFLLVIVAAGLDQAFGTNMLSSVLPMLMGP
ncbi:MAG TPA: hypothetical protein VD860_17095 [Azospirillum sp.]|nr:hypothetical protein [Azospirillum sp.]